MKRLERKKQNRKLSGLCAGLADYMNVDTTVVRILTIAVTILTGFGPGVLFYIVASLITPEEGTYHA